MQFSIPFVMKPEGGQNYGGGWCLTTDKRFCQIDLYSQYNQSQGARETFSILKCIGSMINLPFKKNIEPQPSCQKLIPEIKAKLNSQ